MNFSALFFKRICFFVLPISLVGAHSISQAQPKVTSSSCQKTSLPDICERLTTLYKSNGIPFDIKTPDVCSWKEVKCNPEKKQVIGFDLSGKDIKVLPAGFFDNLSQLQMLNLGNNQLTNLPSGIFAKLSRLQTLYLNDNQLYFGSNQRSNLPPGIFSGLSQLQRLYLGKNRLTTLPTGFFSGLSQLKELDLGGNPFPTNFKLDGTICKHAKVIPNTLCP